MATGIIKRIFNDYWDNFYRIHNKNIRENVAKEVEKMLKCKDIRHGYMKPRCEHCGESKKI